jgi:hypothetical protein
MKGIEKPEHKWGRPGSRFIVVEGEGPPRDGKARRDCDVKLSDESRPITADEERRLVATFLEERGRPTAAGDHEVRDPVPIFSTSLRLGPKALNSSGCRVISYLSVDTRPDLPPFFYAGSGEQAGGCGAPPRLR